MVQATGFLGGMTMQASGSALLTGSTACFEVAAQPASSIHITDKTVAAFKEYLGKVSAPDHADPDSADQEQTHHGGGGTHILGPARKHMTFGTNAVNYIFNRAVQELYNGQQKQRHHQD